MTSMSLTSNQPILGLAYNYVPAYRCQTPPRRTNEATSREEASGTIGIGDSTTRHPSSPTFAEPKQEASTDEQALSVSTSDFLDDFAAAYDEDPDNIDASDEEISAFRWTGIVDAAQAAWIGGVDLLNYGELRPVGLDQALQVLLGGAGPVNRQFAIDLGGGRGRPALLLFLAGATVLTSELAEGRFELAAAALERLAHRRRDRFQLAARERKCWRLCRRGGSRTGNFLEIRLGNFFENISSEELSVASLVLLHVSLPATVWPSVRQLISALPANCRILASEDLRRLWPKQDSSCPLSHLASLPFSSLSPAGLVDARGRGPLFHCFEKITTARPAYAPLAVEA